MTGATTPGAGDAGDACNDDDGADLHGYLTCGDPVCRPPGSYDAGSVEPCTAGEDAGAPCGSLDAGCGEPADNCGVILLCTDHAPRARSCPN